MPNMRLTIDTGVVLVTASKLAVDQARMMFDTTIFTVGRDYTNRCDKLI